MMDERQVRMLADRLEAMGALIGLAVDPVYRENVAWYLAELLDAADLLAGFPLAVHRPPTSAPRPRSTSLACSGGRPPEALGWRASGIDGRRRARLVLRTPR